MERKKKGFRVIKKKIKEKKTRQRIVIIISTVILLLLIGGLGLFFYSRQTFHRAEIVEKYESAASNHGNYVSYGEGVLKYSRDGVALFDSQGKELWNHPCQIKSPIIEKCGETAVLGDMDGTNVLVLQKAGVKGEFQTDRPIEQLAVSKQGIVAAVLKDETTPKLICYDARGNVLVEQKASLANTGYPLDIAISPDGKTMIVSYLCISDASVYAEVIYYNFDTGANAAPKYEVARTTYEGQMIPTVAFMDETTSIMVSDKQLIVWEGTQNPKQKCTIPIIGEIQQVAYNEKFISLVVEEDGKDKKQLYIYNKKGQQQVVKELDRDYAKITMTKEETILYEESHCYIVNASGVIRFAGELDVNIQSIAKLGGFSKYLVADNEGIYKIQLKK